MKSRVRNATKENARQVQHDARFIGVSEQPEPVAELDSELRGQIPIALRNARNANCVIEQSSAIGCPAFWTGRIKKNLKFF